MYFKSIQIENTGPIRSLQYEFEFNDGKPKPLLVVGGNGSGKSIFLSHLMNPIMAAQAIAFDDAELDKNKVFKLRTPSYIRTGETYSFSRVVFGDDFEQKEWFLSTNRENHDGKFGCPLIDRSYDSIPASETSSLAINFGNKKSQLIEQFNAGSALYFPPNRFEEPAWLNVDNLKSKAKFRERIRVQGISNRNIIQERSLSKIKDLFLDILLDKQLYEQRTITTPVNYTTPDGQVQTQSLLVQGGTEGPSSRLWEAIGAIIKLVIRKDGNVRFRVGPRHNRSVALMIDEEQVVPNIFQLSTGQTSLLNIAFSIMRDFDMTGAKFDSLDDLKGTVVIDEIDLHLHAELQCNVLPSLLAMFPRIQFVVSTHSPLFLLGMKQLESDQCFDTISLPEGTPISIEDFEEFNDAFNFYNQSEHFRRRIDELVEKSEKPSIFFEGDYDLKYVRRAAELLEKEDTLDKVKLYDGDGFGNLNNIWKGCKTSVSVALPRIVGLIYDCDIDIQDSNKDMVRKRVIPSIDHHVIEKGIENLFPASVIEKLRASHMQFFDIKPEMTALIRGTEVQISEKCSINRQEKRNMCDHLSAEGSADDFREFNVIFDLIEEIIE